MSEEYLMTGSVGLDVDAWQGNFYDDDLPADWRAAYYSTLLRSVLLHAKEWRKAVDQDWVDEVDEEFRFVLHIAPGADDLASLVNEIAELRADFAAQVAGVVVKCSANFFTPSNDDAFAALQNLFPLCLDAGEDDYADSGMDVLSHRYGMGCVWYPAAQEEPLPSGDFLVTLINRQQLPEQKAIVAKIEKWMSGQRRAGLFNMSAEDAPLRAQETRILAELMGV